MRRLPIALVSLLLFFAACSKDEGLNKIAKDEQRQEITITASQMNEGTKTIREADGKVFWKPGDEINVFFKSDEAKFTSTNTEDAATVAFSGSLTISSIIGMTEGAEDDNYLWGLYPYDSDATFDGYSITTTLSSDQTGVAGTFADDLYITLAKNNSFALAFYNVLSGFKFTVTRDDISSIVFSGNNGETLTGKLKLAFGEDGKPCVQSISEGQTSITLTPENGTFETGKSYYFVFVPTNFTKGFSVTMTTTDDKEGTFVYENSVQFNRNVFKNKSEIDTFVDEWLGKKIMYINTLSDLKSLRDAVNKGNSFSGYTIYLTSDIDMKKENWTPIGRKFSIPSFDGAFKGAFDGQGHTIKNFLINSTATSGTEAYFGLFGICSGAVIRNLILSGEVNVPNSDYIGALVGLADNIVIENCRNYCDVKGNGFFGGLAGCVTGLNGKSKIIDCGNTGQIISEKDGASAGGIVGDAQNTDIYFCYNSGKIDGSPAGGIVGNSYSDCVAFGCENGGDITSSYGGTCCGIGPMTCVACFNQNPVHSYKRSPYSTSGIYTIGEKAYGCYSWSLAYCHTTEGKLVECGPVARTQHFCAYRLPGGPVKSEDDEYGNFTVDSEYGFNLYRENLNSGITLWNQEHPDKQFNYHYVEGDGRPMLNR